MSLEDHMNKLRETFMNMSEDDRDRLMQNMNERAESIGVSPDEFMELTRQAASASMFIRHNDPEVFEACLRHVQNMGETVGVNHFAESHSQKEVEEINDILVDAAERIHEVMEENN